MAVEVTVGILASSLALLSDAAHMLTDATAIGLSIVAIGLAHRPAVVTPPAVAGVAVLVVALIGLVVNLAATWTLSRANRQSMNVEGAYQHILTDLIAFIVTAVAGAVILATGFRRADGIAWLVVAAVMLHAAYGLLKASGGCSWKPRHRASIPMRSAAPVAEPGVTEVHDLHVWEITSGFAARSAHVLVGSQTDCHAARRRLEALLHAHFHIEHTTLQVDHQGGELLTIELPGQHDLTTR